MPQWRRSSTATIWHYYEDIVTEIRRMAGEARTASRQLAKAPGEQRTAALVAIAAALEQQRPAILAANAADVAAARGPLLDRLRLDEARLAGLITAVREIAAQPDPVGQTVTSWRRPNGLKVARQRIPLGVIALIYEARPNVTTDAAALCLRSGNAALLRGGSEAFRSNQALMQAVAVGLSEAGLPAAAIQLIPTTDRVALVELLQHDAEIDLVIPRGGEALIRFVADHSRIPVIKHYRGNCHIFVEQTADPGMALEICYNAKVQRPGVCNAVETILVDEAIAPSFLPQLAERFAAAGVEFRADAQARAVVPSLGGAVERDFATEFLDLTCALGVVQGVAGAVRHIERYGSSHTESIVTRDEEAARRFIAEVDSACVMVNTSTRFADGGELGLGAEIGISTTRLHAYGPMGAEELTTTKFVVIGEGQTRT